MSVRIVFTRHITVSKQNRMLFVLLPVYAFLCGFVFIEPSPAELFFLVSAPLLLFHLRFAGEKLLLFLLFGISTMVSLVIGLMNGLVNERYFIIDIYLFTLFFIFSSVKISRKAFHRLFRIMIIAWTLACLGNFLFYFYAIFTGRTVLFGTQIAAFGIRFKGLFKDPNVLGPFMIVPATYWLNEFLSKSQYRKLTFFTGLIMSLGVILSFSRAAWISYFAVLSLVVLTAFKSSKSWLRVLLLIFLFVLLFNFLARADLSI